MKIQIITSSTYNFYFGDMDVFKNIVIMKDEFENKEVYNNMPHLQSKFEKFCRRLKLEYKGVTNELV